MAADELDEMGFATRRRSSNWEAPFITPSAPPAPYSESSTYSMDNNYPQFNYNNFSDVGPPPMGQNMHLRQDMNLPPAPPAPNISWGQPPPSSQEDLIKREAIASELRNQCATLALQKEEYLRKASVLKREIETLKDQRTELRGDNRRSPSPESQRFLKENARLQGKLHNKLKTVNSVIDMLNGIIENNPAFPDVLASANDKGKNRKSGQRSTTKSPSPKNSSSDNDKHSSRRGKHKSSSGSEKKFNYAYYDPELHWCRICNEFPATAKDYLTHLHTPQHHRAAAEFMETPWHNSTNQNEGFPSFPGAPIKRTPIKGLQFFIPSTAWFCKLCDQWIGDLHCASAHLKSVVHSRNYTNFIELNPHWEMDWMSDRQKTIDKYRKDAQTQDPNAPTQYSPHTISFQPDGCHTKIKKESGSQGEENNFLSKAVSKKEKKKREKKEKKKQKKKRSLSESSSSSSGSSTDSRVDEMKKRKRNEDAPIPQPPPAKVDENDPDDRLLNQWMSVQQTSEQDRKMLEEVKNRVKTRAGERTEQRIDGRVVSREREARALLSIRNEHVRAESSSHSSKNDSKDKEKEHRSHRDKEKDRKDKDRDKSHRGRDRDGNDDRYRYSSSINKVYSLADSDFKPYPSSKRETHDHNEARFEKQVSSKSKKHSSSTNNSNDSKKMPFIGKMPLYKSLGTTTKPPTSKPESEPSKASDQDCIEAARRKRDEINLQLQVTMESFKEKIISSIAEKNKEMEAQAQAQQFPEPKLVIPTLHSYPAMMDIPEVILNKPVDIGGLPQTIHRIQPMTYVAPTTFSAPSTVNASPPTSTKPGAAASKDDLLHKDFQDALDIIFPSDHPSKKEGEAGADAANDETQVPAQADDAEMQLMAQGVQYPGMQQMIPGVLPVAGYMSAMPGMMMGYDYSGAMYNQDGSMYVMAGQQEMQPPLPANSKTGMNNQDMEDLAMLGIDAEDVGASGF